MMKQFLPFLLIIVFFSCNHSEQKQANIPETNPGNAGDQVPVRAESQRTFTGKINDKYNIVLQLKTDQNRAEGNYFYENKGIDISLKGKVKGNNLELNEYNPEGNATAKFRLELNGPECSGTWESLQSGKKYAVELRETNQEVKPLPANLTGTYRSSEETDCKLSLTIQQNNGAYSYILTSDQNSETGAVTFVRSLEENENYIVLNKSTNAEKEASGQQKGRMEALITDDEIMFQNSGNAMNPYLNFLGCGDKYIVLAK